MYNPGVIWVYVYLDKKQKAIEAFDKALDLDPSYEPAKMNRELIITQKNKKKGLSKEITSVEYYKDDVMKKNLKFRDHNSMDF